jgi:hypothetical protein
MQNLLTNPGFEGGWTRDTFTGQEFGEIFVPEGWVAWWKEGLPVPHDPTNDKGYARPEMHVINHEPPYLDPPRIHLDYKAFKLFTFFRIHDAGLYQQVSVDKGDLYRAGGWAHAWSSLDDNPYTSNLDGDGVQNIGVQVGIDPTGRTDPWGDSVVWGETGHIYNTYGQVPGVTAEALSETVTVFLRSQVLWPFKHCDVYWDAMLLERVTDDPEPPPTPNQRMVMPGLHLNTGDDGASDEYRSLAGELPADAPLPSVKAYGDPPVMGTLELFKTLAAEAGRDILTIGRLHRGIPNDVNVEGPNLDGDLRREAERVMDASMRAWDPHREYVDVWEIINEQDPPGADGHRRLAEFMFHCMDIADANGYLTSLFSYSLGVPEWTEMLAVAETGILAEMKARGHALALHEYANPLDKDFGSPIPGREAHPDRGPLACRFRWWEDAVGGAKHMPLVDLTEVNVARDLRTMTPENWGAQMRWYLNQIGKSPYIRSMQVFGWGSLGGAWAGFDLKRAGLTGVWRELVIEAASYQPDPEPEPNQYDRYVIMADPTYMSDTQRMTAYMRGFEETRTVTNSWHDAVQVNRPPEWRTNTVDAGPMPEENRPRYRAWVENRDPDTVLVFADTEPDPGYPEIVNHSQRDERWADDRLGTSALILGKAGCVVTAFASLASPYDPDLTPGEVNRQMTASGGFVDGALFVWAKGAELVDELEFVQYHTWRDPGQVADMGTVRRVLANGPAIMQVDFYPGDPLDSHFVLGLQIVDDGSDILVMDPWTGTRRKLLQAYGPGKTLAQAIYALAEYRTVEEPPPPPPSAPAIGFNDMVVDGSNRDILAAQWLLDYPGPRAIAMPVFLGGDARPFDFTQYADAGIDIYVNLRYSWSSDLGGGGTMPAFGSDEYVRFIQACIQTIKDSRGVAGYTLCNEINNVREHPKDTRLTVQNWIAAYNSVYAAVDVPMGPGALDPFNAQLGDPRDWLREMYTGIDGAELVPVHGYIRGPDPEKVGSTARFVNDPMTWQYLNYPLCIEALLEALPGGYRSLPVVVTEFNHLWRTQEYDWGWVDDARAREVVLAAYQAADTMGYAALCLYRWARDEWFLYDNQAVLGAVESILQS